MRQQQIEQYQIKHPLFKNTVNKADLTNISFLYVHNSIYLIIIHYSHMVNEVKNVGATMPW